MNENLFCVVGIARSGTSWLHKYLHQHPEIYTPLVKEIDYFSQVMSTLKPERIQNMETIYRDMCSRLAERGLPLNEHCIQRKERVEMRCDGDYRAFFEDRAKGRPCFDVSPTYSNIGPDGFQRIVQAFPEVRLIMLMRNPPERVWSSACHRCKLHFPHRSIEDVFHEMGKDDRACQDNLLESVYSDMTSAVDPSRVFCLYTEDLFDPERQQDTLDKLSEFAGVSPHPVGAFEYSANRGSYHTMPDALHKQVVIDSRAEFEWAMRLAGRIPNNWQRDYEVAFGTPIMDGVGA